MREFDYFMDSKISRNCKFKQSKTLVIHRDSKAELNCSHDHSDHNSELEFDINIAEMK